jgi:hypothetical protein
MVQLPWVAALGFLALGCQNKQKVQRLAKKKKTESTLGRK